MLRKLFFVLPVAALAVGGSTAWATEKFVRTSVADVNTKVDSLGRSVEETQERTRQNEGKIADVDQRAQAGITAADQKATQAGQAAQQAQNTATQAANAAREVDAKADAL